MTIRYYTNINLVFGQIIQLILASHDNILKDFDRGEITGMIVFVLQKAFDTIDYKILLDKLVFWGFHTGLSFIVSYLAHRF